MVWWAPPDLDDDLMSVRELNRQFDRLILDTFRRYTSVEKTATQKLDEVKSTVANLEGQVKRKDAELRKAYEENARLRSPLQRDERALYINRDGTLKNGQVHLEQRADRLWETGPAYEVNYQEVPGFVVDWRERGRALPVRRFRYAFSQGSLHVYREIE